MYDNVSNWSDGGNALKSAHLIIELQFDELPGEITQELPKSGCPEDHLLECRGVFADLSLRQARRRESAEADGLQIRYRSESKEHDIIRHAGAM